MATHQLRLRLLILAQVALCAALVWLYPLSAGLFKPRLGWAMQSGANPTSLVIHLSIYAGLFAIHFVSLKTLRGMIASGRVAGVGIVIWLGWALCSFILLFSFPGESADVFDYAFRGRMMVEYGYSPLVTTPYELRDFPFHRYVSWSQWVDAYGPIWEYVSAAVAGVTRALASPADLTVVINQTCENQLAVCHYLTKYVTAYRLLAIGLTGVCGWLIGRLVRREETQSAQLAFLLNPLTLIATAVGAHNEPLLIGFVLLAVFAFVRSQFVIGLLLLVLAAHVKITALLVLPAFALWLLHQRGWRRTLSVLSGVGVIGIALSWLLYAPLGGWASLPKNFFERTQISTNSWAELVYLGLRFGLGWARFESQQIVARIAPMLFVLISLPFLWRWLRHRPDSPLALPRWVGTLVLLYLLIGSYWFQAWYVLWPLALLCCVPGKTSQITTTFGFAALVSAIISDYLRSAELPGVGVWQISALAVAIILIPVLLHTVLIRNREEQSPE